jgi:methyltransferase (TIGR00027 family)
MLPRQPSRTIVNPAIQRAAHQLLDAPLIFIDPLAVGFIPEASEPVILSAACDLRSQRMTLLRSLMVLRSRFAEDRLAEAAARGTRQYVMIGAGFDTFPWRQPDFARNMQIFAVDHPATLGWAQRRLRERGLPAPSNLTFLALDLERDSLAEKLVMSGFTPEAPCFCSMLGVMQYLRRATVDALLGFVGSLPRGSQIVFTFNPPDDELSGDDLEQAGWSVARGASFGEPWKCRLRSRELFDDLARFGYGDVFHLTPELAQSRYFNGQRDGLRASRLEQLMAAIV